jgi:hypothetical protein
MSVGSLGGIISSAAGAPLSQTAGSETERAQKDSLAQSRQVDANQKAEMAAGIGQTEQDQESSERDADGRRLWEAQDENENKNKSDKDAEPGETSTRQSKDATGQSGTKLDLTG